MIANSKNAWLFGDYALRYRAAFNAKHNVAMRTNKLILNFIYHCPCVIRGLNNIEFQYLANK